VSPVAIESLPAATEEVSAGWSFAEVEAGVEIRRILALPRRRSPSNDSTEDAQLAAFLTGRLAHTPTPYPGPLRPLQAAALKEAYECRGLAGFLRVGAGKTVISFLVPTILRTVARDDTWLLVAPKSMEPSARQEWRRLSADWPAVPFHYVSREKLSTPGAGEKLDKAGNVIRLSLLEQLRPAVLVIDEAHGVGSVLGKRIKAYLRKYPGTIVVALTGTPFRSSVRDAAWMLEWCLGDRSPLPRPSVAMRELMAWSSYLDAGKPGKRRAKAGVLLEMLTRQESVEFAKLEGDEEAQRRLVRRAVARRMYDTPGVISSKEAKLVDDDGREIGLSLHPWYPVRETPEVDAAIAAIRERGALPDGTELEGQDDEPTNGFTVGRHVNTLALGFWQRYVPEPPEAWRAAQRDWAKWCRTAILRNRHGLDSPARVVDAVRQGLYNDGGRWERWQAAQADYRAATGQPSPPTVAEWVSDEAIESVGAWVSEHAGAVWVRHICLGERLAERLGIPYYGEESVDKRSGTHVTKHPGGPAVLSLQANAVGKNLQGFWAKNLWLCPPGEQAIGRTHRSGQAADVVENWVFLACAEHARAFERAQDELAAFQSDMTLNVSKLEMASCTVPTAAEVSVRGYPRWVRKSE